MNRPQKIFIGILFFIFTMPILCTLFAYFVLSIKISETMIGICTGCFCMDIFTMFLPAVDHDHGVGG
jgi:hypothetical protein